MIRPASRPLGRQPAIVLVRGILAPATGIVKLSVSDGQLSGLVNKGIVVGEVPPEAADGGPLALVEDGDRLPRTWARLAIWAGA